MKRQSIQRKNVLRESVSYDAKMARQSNVTVAVLV